MKIKWLILIVLIVFLAVSANCVYAFGGFEQVNKYLTAGFFDFIYKPLDCVNASAECYNDLYDCQAAVEKLQKKCNDTYNRRITTCQSYRQKSQNQIPECEKKYTSCMSSASKYQNKPDRYNIKIQSCQKNLDSCKSKASQKVNYYNQKADQCYDKASQQKSDCQRKYWEQQPKKVSRCFQILEKCIQKVQKKCS